MKWEQQLSQSGSQSLPATANAAIQEASCTFLNIRVLLKILCTMPVTSCSDERSFSALKRIKTPIRSMMANERLTDLALLHIHRDIPVDTAAIINEFAQRHPRRLEMANTLSSD